MRPLAFALVLVAGSAVPAAAQPAAPAPAPLGSGPYLNLLRNGNPAATYYGIVRPEQNLRNQLGQLEQQVGRTNTAVRGVIDRLAPAGDQVLGDTGHGAGFDNTMGYFNRLPVGGTSGRAGTGGAGRPGIGTGQGPPSAGRGISPARR